MTNTPKLLHSFEVAAELVFDAGTIVDAICNDTRAMSAPQPPAPPPPPCPPCFPQNITSEGIATLTSTGQPDSYSRSRR